MKSFLIVLLPLLSTVYLWAIIESSLVVHMAEIKVNGSHLTIFSWLTNSHQHHQLDGLCSISQSPNLELQGHSRLNDNKNGANMPTTGNGTLKLQTHHIHRSP
jgi:hypothetical protein